MRHVILVIFDGGQQVGHQGIRGLVLFAEHLEHLFFVDGPYGAGGQGDGCGRTKRIACQAKLAKEIMRAQDRGDCGWLVCFVRVVSRTPPS